ncbi:hypothetical protein IFM89_024276 [Coptis chinensis]|uniref:Bromo domain-containing protein n=1 Tax=Coptis chinensis TaxID=261450 RepID=A0A835LR98_9MAGN|nr:hypothetical protein IFM89_024276 [Coptis chinensis]
MGKKIVEEQEKKKKKLGRPSLLDIQKRSIKQTHPPQKQNKNNPYPDIPNLNPDRRQNSRDEYRNLDTASGTEMESSSTTAMPDTNLLVFILDTLQKKDTYGVFSEPVDSKELPDYHDIVEHPMDFRTVREKLETGAYVKLEQFEKDVFLICSNAMRYNALDTIYFRQARSIEELAKKNFENVRQDSDDNELQQTIVKRGRPPTTNPKKRLGRPPIVRTGSDLSSGATLADAGENNIDLRRGSYEKSGPSETSGRIDHRSCSNDSFTWSSEHTSGGNDEFPASVVKGISVKFGKKLFVLDESRRNTYKQSHLSGRSFPSVLATFRGEKKQLMAVGLHMEHGFARSLARFAASLGPVAWKIASKKIERALPTGVKFGPGWVGENESPLSESLLTIHTPAHLFSEQPFSVSKISSSATVRSIPDVKVDKVSERQVPSNNSASDVYLNRISSPSTAASSLVGNLSSELTTESVEATRPKLESRDCLLSSNADGIMLNPPFQIHQGPVLNPSVNSFQNLLADG